MTIDYSRYMSADEKKTLLTNNLRNFAADHYANSLNKTIALGNGAAVDSEIVKVAEANMAALEATITTVETELAAQEVL